MPEVLTTAQLPPLLTAIEAAQVLRLMDDGRDEAASVKALNRIVDSGLLRPCLVGKFRRYSAKEILRFIDARTDHYAEAH